jgi:iron complex transport system substrate-binding protein
MKRIVFIVSVIFLLLNLSASEAGERSLTDEAGRRVKVPLSAKRIISLAPSTTEILFAMGLRQEIAGVTNFCDYPEDVSTRPRIGGFVNPDVEKIVSLKPDLIIAITDGNRWETIERLSNLGFPVYTVDPKGFDGVIRTIRNMGEIIGKEEESRALIRRMMERKEKIVTLTRPLPKPAVFFQVGDAPVITVGKGTLANDLIRLAGGRSISENEPLSYPPYGIETILSKAPEIIIFSSMDNRKNYSDLIRKWQAWKSIPAVKSNSIYVIDSNLVDRPAPRIVEGLEALARIIHPEVFIEKVHTKGGNQKEASPIP